MVKEGFNETFTGHVISFKYVGKSCPTYWVPKNEGGNLVIDFKDLTSIPLSLSLSFSFSLSLSSLLPLFSFFSVTLLDFGNLGEVKTVDLVKLL